MDGATELEAVFDLPADVPFYALASVYDFVYSRNFEYDRQATRVRRHVRDEGVLELACGTGRLAARLQDAGTYVAVDAAAPMLAVARRVADAHLVRADVRRVAFDRPFGAVALLGRSSAHFGHDDLRSVATVALDHLEDGGFVLDAHHRATLADGHTIDDRYETDRWTVRYRGESTTTGGGWCNHEYLLDVRDRRCEERRTFEGDHDMRFWGVEELRGLLEAAGFDTVRIDATDGRVHATALPP